jgi:hypothetical protein
MKTLTIVCMKTMKTLTIVCDSRNICFWYSGSNDNPCIRVCRRSNSFFKNIEFRVYCLSPVRIGGGVASYSAPGGMRAGFEYYRAFPITLEQNKEHANVKLPMPVLALGGEHSFGTAALDSMKLLATNVWRHYSFLWTLDC